MSFILETDGLTKTYGRKRALDNVSVHVGEGDIYGLVGRNGAGKTTLMKIAGGLASANSGSCSLFGLDVNDLGDMVLQRGLLIEDPGVYPEKSGLENMKIKCLALGVKDKSEPERLLELMGIKDAMKKHVKNYSYGMKQRLGLALALAGNPKLMILDEPINGFDPEGIRNVREMILEKHRQGTTFIISSHILGELSKIATKYGFINEGKLVEESTAEDLKAKCISKINLVTDNPSGTAAVIERLGFASYKVFDGGRTEIYEQLERTGDISNALSAQGIAIYEITKKYETLEDYYIGIVGADTKEEEEEN